MASQNFKLMRSFSLQLKIFLVVWPLLTMPLAAVAEIISPVAISNYSPLVAIHGLPYIGSAELLRRGEARTRLLYDVSSHYAQSENEHESLFLDGETYRTTFIYQQGVSSNFQMGFIIPYIKHKAGDLDSFINAWHDVFGMPEGGRDLVEDNQFLYRYVRDSRTRFDMSDGSSGIGDARMEATWLLQQSDYESAAVAFSVKFPTGNSRQFHGSGAVDAALWLKHELKQTYFGFKGSGFYSLGWLYLGKGDVLPDIVKTFVGFGGVGAGVYLTDSVMFISQLDINTPFYSSSELAELGEPAVQLTLGGSILFAKHGRINLGVGEDLVIDASPDVTFHVDVEFGF